MVHEVAHYFWRWNQDWLDEGIANAIEQNYAQDAGLPSSMTTTQREGCTLNTLQDLSRATHEHDSPSSCTTITWERLLAGRDR